MSEIAIWFDGGSHNNQSASLRQGYGSFVTFYNGKQVPMTIDKGTRDEKKVTQAHLDWGNTTNNEAEWKTFMAALWYAISVMNSNVGKALTFALHGDSMNVLGVFIDGNKVKAKNLIPLREEAENLLNILHDGGAEIDFVKEEGAEVKHILGH